MVNVLIALNTRMQLPMCNIANVLLLMLMLLKRVIWIFDIGYVHTCTVEATVLYNGNSI